jgi:aspartyl-tRNA(Asn)/glutamyl-tRNA(Gln) amidotransferase subunit A
VALSPRISGTALRTLARLSHTRAGARAFFQIMRSDLRVGRLQDLPEELFGAMPIDNRPLAGRPPRQGPDAKLPPPPLPWTATSATLIEAYRSGRTTPREVVDRALEAAKSLAARKPSFGPLMESLDEVARHEADAATERWRQGKPLGPLDGVPTAVKEHIAVRGRPTSHGSDLSTDPPAEHDATCVARLRGAGVIVLGRTPMTEFGMTPLGFNPKRSMPRNPHAPDRVAGGSSTGSAVAVATGLVPFAMGSDGGGSIRVPSSLCGVFGIKPTWGRVSLAQASSGSTVTHLGPLAASTVDLALCLEVICGPDPGDAQTELAPPRANGSFVGALPRGVAGMRIGLVETEWADASPAVSRAGHEALRALEKDGAKLVDLRLELARWAAAIGYVSIGMESMSARRDLIARRAAFTPDLCITFSALGEMSAIDYVHAQRLRSGMRSEAAQAFGKVDLIALLANLTGLPALSAPVGLDEAKLPLGLQLVGDAWDEATLLAAAAHLERTGAARVERPTVCANR